ncbi:MAG: GNAT family N-acetyltransferase [Rhodobacteraceae bacterium]|nr:GNAT family N-acetyltransferase [Paracoccaceae bacterium]MCF8514591.1 GNAT family N-acetyltransferase [Paracoccaceae bacterium]MCF8518868.1 GNAT family N-acetyltransferase [Paracoccaceae bacterium]
MPSIRPLTASADRAAVVGLVGRAADYILLETGLPPDDQTVEDIFAEAPPGIGPEGLLTLGLFRGETLDGLATMAFGWPEPTDAYLGLMLLAPNCRGMGIGPLLLDACMAEGRARGATRLLLAVLDENPRARRFWHSMGFTHLLTAAPAQIGVKTHIRHRLGRAL